MVAQEYPRLDIQEVAVPKADKDIQSVLDQAFPTSVDKQLCRIQASVQACSTP